MLCSPFLGKRKYEHPSRLSDFSADISKTNRISIDILRTKQQLSKMSTTPFMQRLNDYLEYFLLRTYQCSTFLTDANEAFQINKVEKKNRFALHTPLKVQKVYILCELFSMQCKESSSGCWTNQCGIVQCTYPATHGHLPFFQ